MEGEGEHGREVVGRGRKDIYENIYLTHKPAELLPTQDTLEAALRLLSSIPSRLHARREEQASLRTVTPRPRGVTHSRSMHAPLTPQLK